MKPAPQILEGAGHKADPFEYPINTVQVFRCAPFLGSPFVGVALGLMTINVRTHLWEPLNEPGNFL